MSNLTSVPSAVVSGSQNSIAHARCQLGRCISADQAPAGVIATLPDCCLERAIAANPSLALRLKELGIRPGTTMKFGQKISGGGRIVTVGSARYAIDRRTLQQLDIQL